MATISEKKSYDWEMGMEKLLAFTKQNYPQDLEYMESWVLMSIYHLVIQQMVFTPNYHQYALHLKNKFGYLFRKAWKLPNVDLKRKAKSYVFWLSPGLYGGIWRCWEKVKKYVRK